MKKIPVNPVILSKRAELFAFFLGVTLVFIGSSLAHSDIYRFQDEQGVWHFTNIKTDRRYQLYIRSYSKKPSQYIKEYDWIIKQASSRFNVDPNLIKAVIKAESDFDHRAISRKGAQGLMQLMPQTADDMDVDNPFNPEENIFGGTRYLSILLGRFKNDKKKALAAYNAGPNAVEDYKGIPPFQETQTFIRRVLDYYEKYQAH